MRLGISALLFNLDKALELCREVDRINHIEVGIDNLDECIKLSKYKGEFDKLNLSLLVARLLYPSYYFDLFEEIIDKELDENIIFPLTKKSSKYEEFIDLIIKNCNLQNLQWLSR